MARSRNIKPAFFVNDVLTTLSPLTRILFIGLWCLADRDGFLENRPRKIKWQILPHDDCDIENMLDNLRINGFITFFELEKVEYIQILNFKKHQKPHKNEGSIFISDNEIGKKSEPLGKKSEGLGKKPDTLGKKLVPLGMNEERGMMNDECGLMNVESRDPDESRSPPQKNISSNIEQEENDNIKTVMRPFPDKFVPNENHKLIADGYGLDLRIEIEKCKSSSLERGKLSYDWNASFSSWLHRARNFQHKPKGVGNVQASSSQRRKTSAEVFWEHHVEVFGEGGEESDR